MTRLDDSRRRKAFVRAEAATRLAHQIRVLRLERGLSQAQLARLLGTTQAAVSRLEDSSYGRVSIQTLLSLAEAFDVALDVRFRPTIDHFVEAEQADRSTFSVVPYEEDRLRVEFAE